MTTPGITRAIVVGLWCLTGVHSASGQRSTTAAPRATASLEQPAPASTVSAHRALLDRYCVTCHNARLRTADLALDSHDLTDVGAAPEVWERVSTSCAPT